MSNQFKLKDGVQYRDFRELQENIDEYYIVEGYAATWQPYILYQDGERVVYEQISKDAFKGADFSDCVMRENHVGKVFARTSNGTLKITLDDKGMFIRADLSKTDAAKELYQDVKAEMLTKMSWAFTVKEEHYDAKTSIRHIDAVSKVWDVAIVTHPANNATSVQARDYFNGVLKPIVMEYEARKALIDEYMEKRAKI